jgi:hypothetical protein
MQKITWECLCCICRHPIYRGKPTIFFTTDRPMLVGICRSWCNYNRYSYGLFQMCPPDYLSDEQISFLVQCYHRFYNLSGGPVRQAGAGHSHGTCSLCYKRGIGFELSDRAHRRGEDSRRHCSGITSYGWWSGRLRRRPAAECRRPWGTGCV